MLGLLSCPLALGLLKTYAVQFDPLLKTPAQRQDFRTYLSGLLLPRDRFLRRSRHWAVPSLGLPSLGRRGATAAVFPA